MLRDESTPVGKAIWEAVEKAAARCPDWIRPHIERIAAEKAQIIREGHGREGDNVRPPDRIFHYGPPENSETFEPLIRPICERINQSGWLWTVESCEGHDGTNPPNGAWGGPDPMVRFGLRTEHVGHLVLLLKRACGADYRMFPAFYAGYCPDEEWSDFLTTIPGDMPLAERRACYARLAELAHSNPPKGHLPAKPKRRCPNCDGNNVNAPCICCE